MKGIPWAADTKYTSGNAAATSDRRSRRQSSQQTPAMPASSSAGPKDHQSVFVNQKRSGWTSANWATKIGRQLPELGAITQSTMSDRNFAPYITAIGSIARNV